MNKYDKLIKLLRANGFECKLGSLNSNGLHYLVTNESETIIGYLSTKDPFGETKALYNDTILFDYRKNFINWSKAPIKLKICESDMFYTNLLKELEFLGSKEGYELSNSFDYKLKFTKRYAKDVD